MFVRESCTPKGTINNCFNKILDHEGKVILPVNIGLFSTVLLFEGNTGVESDPSHTVTIWTGWRKCNGHNYGLLLQLEKNTFRVES